MLDRFGVRWQSGAATPLFARPPASKSGVALRFPPQSKKWLPRNSRLALSVFIRVIRGKKSSQNWEQGRRQPTGPAKVLLKIATRHPKVLLEVA